MSGPGCPRGEDAGAYLLGALDPADRAEYAAHLPHCPDCLREVGQLAGLPGLLARTPGPPRGSRPLSPEDYRPDPSTARAGGAPGPAEAALSEIRRRRQRQRVLVAGGLVLLALVGVAGTVAGASWSTASTGVVAAAALPVTMSPAAGVPINAALELTAKAWGTEVVMRCRYQGPPDEARPPVYTLVATAVDGSRTPLARWSALSDQDVVLATATDVPRNRLSDIEVQDASGAVVLRTDHL